MTAHAQITITRAAIVAVKGPLVRSFPSGFGPFQTWGAYSVAFPIARYRSPRERAQIDAVQTVLNLVK